MGELSAAVTQAGGSRGSYSVQYYQNGVKKVIKRTPPPKLHPLEAGDVVTITRKRNDDWDVGQDVKVKAINSRHPNILQVEKEDGSYTFLPYFDVNFQQKQEQIENNKDILTRDAEAQRKDPIGSKYLLWP